MFFMRIKKLYFLFPYVRFVLLMLNKRLSSSYMFFMRIKMLSFLFAYVLFVLLFVRVGSLRKECKDCPNTLIYYTTVIFFFSNVFKRIKILSHKNVNKRIGDFLPLRCFPRSQFKRNVFVFRNC